MRRISMRPILLSVCSLTAACGGEGVQSPTSPSKAISVPTRAQGKSDAEFPFRGSFTTQSSSIVTPPTLRVTGTGEGTATALGRFSLAVTGVVDLATARGTGTFDFTAANGDQLFTTAIGSEDAFVPPNISYVTQVATIVGGTGRFAEASGTFTIRQVGVIDFATGTSTVTASFEGQIKLKE